MNRILIWAMLLSFVLLTGCMSQEQTRKPFLPNDLAPDESQGYGVETLTQPESLYFDSERNQTEYFALKIYRKFSPATEADTDSLKTALEKIKLASFNFKYENMTDIGDQICPLLYANTLIDLSDMQMESIFKDTGFRATVCSAEKDGFTVRVISFSFIPNGGNSKEFISNFHYTFLQTWNSEYAWVQPISEEYGKDEIKEVYLTQDETNNIFSYLIGAYEYPRNGHATIAYTFQFDGAYWRPSIAENVPAIEEINLRYDERVERLEGFIVPGQVWQASQ